MEPLDLRTRAPRSPYAELDGLMLMPRTIDKQRAQLPRGYVLDVIDADDRRIFASVER